MTALDENDLQILRELGTGGQGTVFLVRLESAAGTVPAGEAAYKRYLPALRAELDTGALGDLVALLDGLTPDARDWLNFRTAWPQALVTRDSTPCGFLMQVAPAEFFTTFGRAQAEPHQLALEHLLNPVEYLHRTGLLVSERDRLELLGDIVSTVTRLHELDVAIGDLSPKNVLISLAPPRRAMLIDCDAVRLRGHSPLPQVDTVDWELPGGEEPATPAGDRYKLALLTLRLMAGDQSTRALADFPPHLEHLRELVFAGLTRPPDERPNGSQWLAAVAAAIPAASTALPAVPAPVAGPPQAQVINATGPSPAAAVPGAGTAGVSAARRGRRGRVLIPALILAGLAAVGGVLVGQAHQGTGGTPVAGAQYEAGPTDGPLTQATYAGTQTDQPETQQPEPSPTVVGIVDLSAVSADGRAIAVGTMFDNYFGGINTHNYDQTLAVFDPAGVVNNTVASQRDSFVRGVSTSQDSDVRLVSLANGDPPVAVLAQVQFRSTQAAGYGPAGNTDQTCTTWDITFQLTGGPGGGYLILRPTAASHQAC